MNEDFVTFELAKKLKEKGFPQRVFGTYGIYGAAYLEDGKFYGDGCICKDEAYTAPTISQVLKWLREEKEIMVFPVYSTNTSKWYCVAINADSLEQYKLSLSDSYEEAALAGANYCLENLI